MKFNVAALLTLFTAASYAASPATLDVTVTGVKQQQGSLRVAVYDSAETFNKNPHLTRIVPVDADTLQFSFHDLPAGEFAIMLFHDVDSNEKMKTNLVGMPTEPWGGSLQGTAVFGPPKWKHVKFAHTDSGSSMNIKLR